MEWLTTSSILASLHDYGDQAAWVNFLRHFHPAILSFNRRLGLDATESEDAAQATYLAFTATYRQGGYDRSQGRLRGWLFGIAHKKAVDLVRARRPTHRLTEIPDRDRTLEIWEAEWRRFVLDRCLARVKHEVKGVTYRAFHLMVLDGKSPEDTARSLGITQNHAYVAKHRVLRRITKLCAEFEEMEELR